MTTRLTGPHNFGALIMVVLVAAVSCDTLDTSASGSSAGGGEPLAEGVGIDVQRSARDTDERRQADHPPRVIAAGEVQGISWRLSTRSGPTDEFLCFEARSVSAEACITSFESTSGDAEVELPDDWALLGVPSLAEGDRSFAFGTVGPGVTRVVIELTGGGPDAVEAEIVGDEQGHYIALLSERASPREVVAYSPDGAEQARRQFPGEVPAEESWTDSWEQTCQEVEAGRLRCIGSAAGGGYVSESGGVEQGDEKGR